MTQILLFGAGKSATSLIRYLIGVAAPRGWRVVIAENNLELALTKIGGASCAHAVQADVGNEAGRDRLVAEADVVISLLPPSLHYLVAQSCLRQRRHLLTASYVDDAIRGLDGEVSAAGLLFLCEMGLDPGIDHMSALDLIGRVRAESERIVTFHSHTGGLVAPESDDNPWHYKISWNPRNVVRAGAAGARFREEGRVIDRDYLSIFGRTGRIEIAATGPLAWYPNRDSLPYIALYRLEDAETFVRTTLRYPAFCEAWAPIVQAGLTDDSTAVQGSTIAEWAAPLLPYVTAENRDMYAFLGLLDASPLPAAARTPADVLQYLLETRLAMRPEDKDMIVMQHEIGYIDSGKRMLRRSTLVVKGEDSLHTAMARTVGLPLGIAAKLLLEGKVALRGVQIPVTPELYGPVLRELEQEGIRFVETVS
ncbi:MAG TPA: saccharopine dehydrogenase C-terminal domain-containing protein [Puia sp.]|jgi:saccharopine dehydrogenase (NADP+, L-glutamate forming)|nr:saccharopine dehydrogenase C-terminal domain-containing protein [Puia sp.]